MGKRFVLIHGAWHGGWCWDRAAESLRTRGHVVDAPTMPGHGPTDDRSRISFQDYVNKIAEVLRSRPEPAVLVGHSSAGFMIQAAAPLVPDKIERLVFNNAFILPDQTSQFDLVPPEVARGMTAAAAASPDNCVPVDEAFVRDMLMAGDPEDDRKALLARLAPQPLALFTTKIDAKPFQALKIPQVVIFCRDDASLPPGAYLGMAQGLGEFDLIEIAGGHETLFVNPDFFVETLLQAAG
ncbi:MAG: alpha/beta fold hydrolase [Pseudomonadota bacterium]